MLESERDEGLIHYIYETCLRIDSHNGYFKNSYEDFLSNEVYMDALAITVIRIGVMIKKLSKTFKNNYQMDKYMPIVDLADVLEHNYENVDAESFWNKVFQDIPCLKSFCEDYLKKSNHLS